MEKPNFYAVIPSYVRYDNDLNPNAKLLFGELSALANDKGYCFATNAYFAKLYEVSKETISRWISILERKQYIRTEHVKEGNKFIMRKIYIVISSPIDENIKRSYQKHQGGIDKTQDTPIDIKRKENNIYKNNTMNSTDNKIKEKYFESDNVNEILDEYLQLRIQMKMKNTPRVIQTIIEKLKKYGRSDLEQIEILENSIVNNWKSLYPLKGEEIGKKHESYINPSREEYDESDSGITFV